MADTEISKLPPLTQAQLRPDDVLPIADVSLVETKKVRADDLVVAGINTLPDGSLDPDILDWSLLTDGKLPGSVIEDRSIAAIKLQVNSLTADEIAANAIGSTELANGAVDGRLAGWSCFIRQNCRRCGWTDAPGRPAGQHLAAGN